MLIMGTYRCILQMPPKTMQRCKKEERPEIDKRCYPIVNRIGELSQLPRLIVDVVWLHIAMGHGQELQMRWSNRQPRSHYHRQQDHDQWYGVQEWFSHSSAGKTLDGSLPSQDSGSWVWLADREPSDQHKDLWISNLNRILEMWVQRFILFQRMRMRGRIIS